MVLNTTFNNIFQLYRGGQFFYMQGYKVKEKTAIVPHSAALNPQFQNSVGTL
jgi:hypothetical protein